LLEKKCPHLKIKSGHRTILPNVITTDISSPIGWLLCLYKKDICGSSIELSFYKNDPSIINLSYSSTHETFQKRNYNTLLRCVAIIVSSILGVKTLISKAINPITLYSLLRYFRGKIYIDPSKPFILSNAVIEGNYMTIPNITYEDARQIFKEGFEQNIQAFTIEVPILPIETMVRQFEDILQTVKCQDGGSVKTKRNVKRSVKKN
jgi:hypothetical protein